MISSDPRATGRAHGKVILLGEHAVVYGAPALAAGIERGARAEARRLPPGAPSVLELGGAAIAPDAGSSDDRARAFAALLGAEAPAVHVSAWSELPAGGGLGSSAALGIAIARALGALDGPNAPEEGGVDREGGGGGGSRGSVAGAGERRIQARAAAWEAVFHGNASGIDAAAASRGGCLRFTRAEGVTPVLPAVDLWLAVGSTGAASSTRAMVEGVARLRARRPEIVDPSIDAIRALVENATLAVRSGDLTGLGRLMDLNQMVLAGLMVSSEAIEELCGLARAAGALGAKLTGAGGGGSVIALVPSTRVGEEVSAEATASAGEAILAAFRRAGYEGFVTRVRARPEGDEADPGAREAT